MYMRIQLTHVIYRPSPLHHSQTINSLPFYPLYLPFARFSLSHCWMLATAPLAQRRDDWLWESTWSWWVEFSSFPDLSLNTQAPHNPKGPSQQGLPFVVCEFRCPICTHIISYHLTMFCCIYVSAMLAHMCVCLWWAACAFLHACILLGIYAYS